MNALLEAEGLHSGYGRVPILAGVTLSIAENSFVGVLGHNGTGKSTLLRTLMGYLPATGGHVRLQGRDITRASPTARARTGIGYVPQGGEIFPALSVKDNLRMGCLLGKGHDEEIIEAILTDIPHLRRLLDRPGGALSGGEQQLLALARCLCGNPKLVLLDEPTEGIQPSIIEEMAKTLRALRARRPFTMLLVEQNLGFIHALSDRVLTLQKGVITGEVPPDVTHDRQMIEDFVGIA
jgi:branched-chain amino acid transport system ATP-binding protein